VATIAGETGAHPSDTAVFGGGCFWCLEALFKRIPGVLHVQSGYCGGVGDEPTYEAVCSGTTGHAEVVKIDFDPTRVSYSQLLRCLFSAHDPTTLNRQGNDIGTQYRSVIFPQSPEQTRMAESALKILAESGAYPNPIVTRVEMGGRFWPAEPYHDDYFARHPAQGYCSVVIAPKLAAFQSKLEGLLGTA